MESNTFLDAQVAVHSFLRWVLLLLLLITIIKAFSGWFGKKMFTSGDRKLSLFTMIAAHTQLLLGLALYFQSPWVRLGEMGAAMKNSILRFWAVEHILGMVVAIVLITIGNSKAKRGASDEKKFRALAILFTLALVLILASIPWPFRAGIGDGRGWF